ncbi:MAG: hypothetical protein IKF82_07470 [Bacilli bacterium]|nr:hypothetical protein [Bacilli bacterium]
MKKNLGLFKLNIQLFATEEGKEENRIEKDQDQDQDYIEAIKTLKENSVPKEKYEELEAKNKKLLGALIDGEQIEPEKKEAKPDLNETIKRLHKEMFVDDFQGTDLDYCSKALELRKAVMERDGEEADIFLPRGHDLIISDNDRSAAKRVAEKMQEAIDQAQGSNKVFIALLSNEIVDDLRPTAKRK